MTPHNKALQLQQKMRNVIVVLFSTLLLMLSGCIVPLMHDIYEPHFEGGKLVDSDVCGYLFNNKDTLLIEEKDYSVRIRLQGIEDGNSSVFFHLSPRTKENLIWIPFNLQMVFPDETISASEVTRHEYGKTVSEGTKHVHGSDVLADKYFYKIKFKNNLSKGETGTLLLEKTPISNNEVFFKIDNVKFTRKKVMDAFYATINC